VPERKRAMRELVAVGLGVDRERSHAGYARPSI
jgi:hypothetical protein